MPYRYLFESIQLFERNYEIKNPLDCVGRTVRVVIANKTVINMTLDQVAPDGHFVTLTGRDCNFSEGNTSRSFEKAFITSPIDSSLSSPSTVWLHDD